MLLPMMFPSLFPFGELPLILGKSLREKAQCLILSHERLRCGNVACQMILFLFDTIIKQENLYFRNVLKPKQPVHLPENTDRTLNIANIVSRSDSSFSLYWYIERQNIQAYTEIFGSPDLMITLTFSNKWCDVKDFITSLKDKYHDLNSCSMPYCPYETMEI